MYQVRITEKGLKEFRKIEKKEPRLAQRIRDAIKSLNNPFSMPYKKLEGRENVYRIRVGTYRDQFTISSKIEKKSL